MGTRVQATNKPSLIKQSSLCVVNIEGVARSPARVQVQLKNDRDEGKSVAASNMRSTNKARPARCEAVRARRV